MLCVNQPDVPMLQESERQQKKRNVGGGRGGQNTLTVKPKWEGSFYSSCRPRGQREEVKSELNEKQQANTLYLDADDDI